MKMTIEVDGEVFARLQEEAVPLVDSANDVLRRILGLPEDGLGRESELGNSPNAAFGNSGSFREPLTRRVQRMHAEPAEPASSRRAAGELLPLEEYCKPILRALLDAGGELRSRDVPAAVAPLIESKLHDADREANAGGRPIWHGRMGWAGSLCRKDGHLDPEAPRGIWRLTAKGRALVLNAEGSQE